MSTGRIETYIHSDTTTPHKGGAIVKVTCQTDFAAKTDEFIGFAEKVAKMAYGAGAASWDMVVECWSELEIERAALAKMLRETVTVPEIVVMKL